MDCDVEVLCSEIDVPKRSIQQVKSSIYCSPHSIDGGFDDNMGLENTWTDDEFVVPPLSDLPIPLSTTTIHGALDVGTFEDSTPSNTQLLDDLEGLFSPVSQVIESQDETVSEDNSITSGSCTAGVCGLRNLGNTCFMSSGIQCLMVTAPIADVLIKVVRTAHHPLTRALSDLTRRIWSGKYLSLQPSQFKSALASYYPQFNDFRQHDCQEFLALLLDGLHEQLNTAGSKESSCDTQQKQFNSTNKNKFTYFDHRTQSTSKDEDYDLENIKCDETELIKELVNEVSEKNNKSNIDKRTLTDFNSSPEPCDSQDCDMTAQTDKEDNNGVGDAGGEHLNNRGPVSPMRDEIPVVINRMSGINDILKDAKTSNLNVLVKKEDANNEIRFDSEKYPRCDNLRRREIFNVNSQLIDNNTCGKRNSSLTDASFSLDFKEGLDLKRVKLHSNSDNGDDKNRRLELERQHKSADMFLEKNERMECERKEVKTSILSDSIESSLLSPNLDDITFDKTSEVEADEHWQKHLAMNKSVVVDTFQGQFKSTVVCSVCKYISVTYEPFMYLSVPLPNAMQKRLKVTFIGESLKHPTEFLLELNKYDTVSYLRDQILIKVSCEVKGPILIAEVFDHHVAKFLEDHQLIRYLNDDRSLYAFELRTLLDKTTVEPIDDIKVEDYLVPTPCIICLEDKDSNMKHHEDCSCILCDGCIAASCNHYGGSTFDCPVCRKEISPESHLKPLKPQPSLTSRMINIPIVFRVDTIGDGNNNQKDVKLFGHPMVIRVPSRCGAEALRKEIDSVIHYKEPYRLLLVAGQGLSCSRCMFNNHCRGCELKEEVNFCNGDSLAIAFNKPVSVLPTTSSLALLSSQASSLTLYDCIQAFSQSEVLDGNNPWFCPQCKQHRCATKTLSVWRYPDFLIVYLKRFVFHNHISTKLEEKVLFPLTGLSLASGSDYDLYACVCHIGGVSAGHYTTYAQHPFSSQWHYFNDSSISKQSPLEEDYSNAYILFYKKQGLQYAPLVVEGVIGSLHNDES